MIKYGEIKHFKAVINLMHLCQKQMHNEGLSFWDHGYPNEEIITEDLEGRQCIVYEKDGNIAGYLALRPNLSDEFEDCFSVHEDFLFIGRVMVHPDFQHQGIGREMLKFVTSLNYCAVRLKTNAGNYKACGLYEKMGFKVKAERTYLYGEMLLLERVNECGKN